MPFDTWTPREKPRAVPGTGVAKQERAIAVPLGDGQEQRVGDGLPHRRETWTLIWTAISNTDADLIEAFARLKGFVTPFWFSPTPTRALKRYTFTSFNRTNVAGHLDAIQIGIKTALDVEALAGPEPEPPPEPADELTIEHLTIAVSFGEIGFTHVMMAEAAQPAFMFGEVVFEFEALDALLIDFMSGLLDPRIAFSRGSTGYFRNADGFLHQATLDQPRFDYGYELDAPPSQRGLLIEGAIAQLAQHTNDFTQTVWTKSSITAALDEVGPDNTSNSASSLLATGANGTADQAITSANGSHSFSPYLKRLVGSGTIEISLDGGTTYTSVSLTSSWKRFSITQVVTNPTLRIRIATSGDKVAVWCAGCEARARASSPMPRGSAAFSRSADVATITGFDFSDFFVDGPGTLFVRFDQPVTNHLSSKAVLSISDGTTSEDFIIFSSAVGDGIGRLQIHDGASLVTNLATSAPTPGAPERHIMTWRDTPSFRAAGAANGDSVGEDLSGSLPTVSRMTFGATGSGSSPAYGYLQRVQYWNSEFSDAVMELRTTPSFTPPAGANLFLTTTSPIVAVTGRLTITPPAAQAAISATAPAVLSTTVVHIGSASNPADNGTATEPAVVAVTPPAGMQAGDLVILIGHLRTAFSTNIDISEQGGQVWHGVERVQFLTQQSMALYYCEFNGTWSADPSIDFQSVGGVQPGSVYMHVFRGPAGRQWVRNLALAGTEQTNAAAPFTVTIGSVTPSGSNPTVTLAGWLTQNIRTFSNLAGPSWSRTGSTQYRNTGAGVAHTASFAHRIQAAAGATGAVSQDASNTFTGTTFTFSISAVATTKLMIVPGGQRVLTTSAPNVVVS